MRKRMTKSQRMRYVGICFVLFMIMIGYRFFTSGGNTEKTARQLCIYTVSEEAATKYEEEGFSKEFFETFLQDPFTDPYYEAFITAFNEMGFDVSADAITADRMRTDPKGCADELLLIYNTLSKQADTDETEKEGENLWAVLRKETFEKVLAQRGGELPYKTLTNADEQVLKSAETMTEA